MADFVIKQLVADDLERELSLIGFDEGYKSAAADKFRYKNFKIFSVSVEQANIIKQTALSVGADCGTHREVIRGKAEKSDVILGGSYSQIKKISEKLKHQPFSLKILAEGLENSLSDGKTKTKLERNSNLAKYIGIVLLSAIPGIFINAYITREQKKASRIADMKAINELNDYRKFK